MNFKRFISGISAFAVAVSAFAAMTVTADAASIPDMAVPAEHEGAYTVTNQSIGFNGFNSDNQIVYEADIYVGPGDYAEIDYIGGYNSKGVNGIGPKFKFDATESNAANDKSKVSIAYNTSNSGWYEIQSAEYYSRYNSGHTVHVKIVTNTDATTADRIGNSYVYVTPYEGENDDEVFLEANGRRRYPNNDVSDSNGNRTISGRNLAPGSSTRTFQAVDLTVSGTATIKNASFTLNKIAVTQNAESVQSFSADAGAAVYKATITNDSINTLSNVTVTAVTNDEEPQTKTATDTITNLAPGSSVVLGIVIENKTADNLESVKVNLK